MDKLRKILCAVFLTLFVGMFLSNTLFPHSHIVRGMIVAHSHPYNPFSENEHQHSDDEIILIAYLANVALIETETQEIPPVFLSPTEFILKEYVPSRIQSNAILFARPRDPPIAAIYS